MSSVVLPNIAPLVAKAINDDPNLIGYNTGIFYLASSIWQLSSGVFIIRYGSIRMSQFSLVIIGIGLMIGITGKIWVFAAAAVLMGTQASFSTPASSHLLARYSPPRYAPLIFSIKQTGVPVGDLLAGTMVPILLGMIGWQGAFMVTGGLCIVFACMLQPVRDHYDVDRKADHRLKPAEIWNNLQQVWRRSELRDLALTMFCFVGLQGLFGSYFVTIVTRQLGKPLSIANYVFSLSMSAAVFARILWGWVGSRLIPARTASHSNDFPFKHIHLPLSRNRNPFQLCLFVF